jgi:hypothetical protein
MQGARTSREHPVMCITGGCIATGQASIPL